MRFLPLLIVVLFVFGCASSSEVTQVRQDVTSVYSEQASYRERTDARLSRMERELKELQRTVGSPDEGLRKQMVDIAVTSENNNEKMKALSGKVEELESQLRAYWQEMKAELRDLKKGRDTSGPAPGRSGNPEELYKQGFDAFQRGAYQDAIQIFGQFVKQNPQEPLVPNAYYWMGEAYMNLKDYEKAIVQFQEVVDKFPKSEKAARAMVRQAEAFSAIGDKKSSTTLLKRVVELFPKTEEARLAERMLRGGGLQ